MSHKKVLIISPGSLFAADWLYLKSFHLNLITLYSFLKEHGISVEVLDLEEAIGIPASPEEAGFFLAKIRQKLRSYTFDIAAISCFGSIDYLATVEVAKACKELNPSCQTVVGGYHPTALPDDFLSKEGLFDYIVKGEGENALLDICRGRYSSTAPQVIEGTPRDLGQGIYLDWEGYPYIQRNAAHIGISFLRGCPFRCSYCAESKSVYKYREYPVPYAVRDLQRAVAVVNPGIVNFYDPLFRIDTPWGEEFISALIKEDFTKPIWLMTRIDMLKEKHIALLSKLNIRIFCGVESLSESMLILMNKTRNPKEYLAKVEENLAHINAYKVLCDFAMVFNYPGETPDTVEETFCNLERMFSYQKETSVMLGHNNNFIYLPGTYIFDNIGKFESEFGTVINHKAWWKEWGKSHLQLCQDIVPSRRAGGLIRWEERLASFAEEHVYRKMSKEAALLKLWFEKVHEAYVGSEVGIN